MKVRSPPPRSTFDDAHLGVDRAFVGGEIGDRALRRCVGIADEAGRQVDGRVFGVLAVAGALTVLSDAILDPELNLDVGVAARLRVEGTAENE